MISKHQRRNFLNFNVFAALMSALETTYSSGSWKKKCKSQNTWYSSTRKLLKLFHTSTWDNFFPHFKNSEIIICHYIKVIEKKNSDVFFNCGGSTFISQGYESKFFLFLQIFTIFSVFYISCWNHFKLFSILDISLFLIYIFEITSLFSIEDIFSNFVFYFSNYFKILFYFYLLQF